MPTVTYRDLPETPAFRFLLEPGKPAPFVLGWTLTAFVDRDERDQKSLRFELQMNGVVIRMHGLQAGFRGQVFAIGWALTHNATTFDDAGSPVLIDVELH
ncbi:hypothetical protein [Nevskia sp.]|uniref:hypothetical protein n=1 Tax=Nevskia sp. TaxID=1929292 RepID=UPI0025FC2A75|nr:hypothetical protein [Nevskia sp.]